MHIYYKMLIPRLRPSQRLLPRICPFLLPFFCLFHICIGQNVTANTACNISQGIEQPYTTFLFNPWWDRGKCIRNADTYGQCSANLEYVLSTLDQLHQSEYSAGATTLALLPTIGALFGTPTAEIWALLRLLPFGGLLAMMLSFGSTLMPTSLEEYRGGNGKYSALSRASTKQPTIESQQYELSRMIRDKVRRQTKMTLPLRTTLAGLCTMCLMLAGVLVAIMNVAVGSVYPRSCTGIWWFPMWYLVGMSAPTSPTYALRSVTEIRPVTVVAIIDSWAQLPFDHYAKLYLSDLRNEYSLENGEHILNNLEDNLRQLGTLKPGDLHIEGSHESTSARNTLLVIISIARDINSTGGRNTPFWRHGLQILLKLGTIIIYVFGTSIFAAVTLLALPMAQMVLIIVVGAGILARVITGNIASSILQQDSLFHVIASNEADAVEIVRQAFKEQSDLDAETKFQIEIEGHIFIGQVRVAKRSVWRRRFLGVLASPYDITRHHVCSHVPQKAEKASLLGSRMGTEETNGV